MPRLHRVIYTSKACISANELAGTIDEIAKSCRRNNSRLGLTGALFFNNEIFAQILEGDVISVDEIMTSIQSDSRHEDLEILFSGEIGVRWFGNWTMAFVALANCAEASSLKGRYDLFDTPQDEVLSFLRRLVTGSGAVDDFNASLHQDVGFLCSEIGKLRPNLR